MFQLSLRSLLVLVALVALAIASLRFATTEWRTVALTIAMLAFWAAIIVAAVDRGPRQAFAIGFVLSIALYGAFLFVIPLAGSDRPEFNPDRGLLPTTRLLRPIFHAVAEIRPIDIRSGQVVENLDPQAPTTVRGRATVSMGEVPHRSVFMTIGHSWWAILLGLCGGLFARWVYLRRTRETLAAGRS